MARTIVREMATFLSSSEHLHTFICLLFALFSFWPFFLGHPTDVEQGVLRSALDGEFTKNNVVSFRSTSLISLSLLAPFFLDYLTELCHIDRQIKKKDESSILQNMNHFEKCVFIVGLFVVPVVAFVPTTCDYLGLLWLCMSRFQIITIVAILRVSANRIDADFDSHSWLSPGLSVFNKWLFTIILTIAVNFSTWTAIYGNGSIITQAITIVLQVFLAIELILPLVRWLLYRRQNKLFRFLNRKIQSYTDPSMSNSKNLRGKSKSTGPSEESGNALGNPPEQLYFPTLYIIVGTLSALLIVSLLMTNSDGQLTSDYLSTYNILFIVIELLLLYYDLRKNKDDSRCHLRALVESRKQYLRYIAHEMRTPLNSAVLGLQLIVDALTSLEDKNEFDEMLHETASDVSKTLSMAVEILANLMTFNKIETGIMTLHKQDINVKQYIHDVRNSFAAEAREKGIRVHIKPLRTMISAHDSDDSGNIGKEIADRLLRSTSKIAGWFASLQNSHSRSASRNGSKRNPLINELEGHIGEASLELLDADVVFADKFKVDQVLSNLLSNALKFSTRGSVVTIRAGFKPATPEKVAPNGDLQLNPPRRGSIQRIKEAFVRTGSIVTKNSTPNVVSQKADHPLSQFVDAGGQSIGGGPSVQSQSRPHGVLASVGDPQSAYSPRRGSLTRIKDAAVSVLAQTGSILSIKRNSSGSQRVLNTNKPLSGFAGGSVDAGGQSVGCGPSVPSQRAPKDFIEGELIVVVTDSGAGLSEENQQQVFQEGMQFNPECKTGGGSGFGLYISKSIVELHGGTIQVFSEGEGKGCTFIFKIPMRRRSSPSPLSAGSSPLAEHQILSTLRPEVNSNRRSSVAVALPQNNLSSHSSPLNRSSGPTVRKKEAQRLGEQRQQLVRSLSGMSLNMSVHRDDGHNDTQSAKKRAIHLANINRSYRSNVSSFREAIRPDLSSGHLSPNGVASVRSSVLVDGTDASGPVVGGGPAVSAQDKKRDSGDDGGSGGGEKAVALDALKDKDHVGPTSLNESRAVQPSKVLSNKTVSTTLGAVEETRATTNTTDKVAKAPSSPRKVSRPATAAYTGPRYHVLVVDDSALSRKMLMKTLKAIGHSCDEAEDGSMAVEMVKEKGLTAYDAILMDFVMPVMDGPAATKAIRALSFTAPIIGCTGNTLDMDVERFQQCGSNEVIGKPFNLALFHQYMAEFAPTGTTNQQNGAKADCA